MMVGWRGGVMVQQRRWPGRFMAPTKAPTNRSLCWFIILFTPDCSLILEAQWPPRLTLRCWPGGSCGAGG